MSRTRLDRFAANLRPPPAYQEYGGDLLGLERVKLMPLPERGLLATLRWSIWANDSLPRDPGQLARVLGLETQDVRAHLSEAVLSFFAPAVEDATRFVCPELAAQKEKLMQRRLALARNGHAGGMASKAKGKADSAIAAANAVASAPARLAAIGKRSERKGEEQNRSEFSKGVEITTTSQQEVREMRRAFGESI